MPVEAIFYHGRGTWRDAAIRTLTGSRYSHCELLAPSAGYDVVQTIGASKRDGDVVRLAAIDLRSGHWDRISYPGDALEAWKRAWTAIGRPYDIGGAILSATALARQRPGRWHCSSLIAMALDYREPHEFSPGMLAAAGQRTDEI